LFGHELRDLVQAAGVALSSIAIREALGLFMTMRNLPPTRTSSSAATLSTSPGHIQWRMLSGSVQAANTSARAEHESFCG